MSSYNKYNTQKIYSLFRKSFFVVAVLLTCLLHEVQVKAQTTYCEASQAEPIFMEDFGSGKNNPGPKLPVGTTTYNFVPYWPVDGNYTIWNSSWPTPGANGGGGGEIFWHDLPDHTGGGKDTTGYMMVVNANTSPGEFYRMEVKDLCPGVTYYFSMWAANVNNTTFWNSCKPGCSIPNMLIKIESPSGAVLSSSTTGNLPFLDSLTWKEYGLAFTPKANETSVELVLVNNQLGGNGNDLVIDDISFRVCFPNVTVTTTPVCLGNDVTINANIGAGYAKPVYRWEESIDGGPWTTYSTSSDPFVLPNVKVSPPVRRYRLIVAEDGNIDAKNCRYVSNTVEININPLPDPKITPYESCTDGGSMDVAVTGGAAPLSYKWSNGSTSSSISGLTPGTYSITVTDKNGCVGTQTATVSSPPPIASTTAFTGVICGFPGSAEVTASSGTPGYTYLWNTGATTSAITGLAPGTYSVLITDAKGCTKTDTVTVTSSGKVTAVAGPVSSICAGSIIPQVITASGGIEYLWNTGATTSSISVIPSITTTYSVKVRVGTCVDSTDVTITVNPLPSAILSGDNVCFNIPNQFTDLSVGNNTIDKWEWEFGDGEKDVTQNPGHTYSSAGTYTVSLIVTNNFGCKDTNYTKVVVNPLPEVKFSSVPVCFHDTTCFSDLSTITTGNIILWSWVFGDPASGADNLSNLKNPCHAYNSGVGPFNVTLTVTSDSGCKSTTNIPALIQLPPDAKFVSSSVCLNAVTEFTSTSTPALGTDPLSTWVWDFGDGSSGIGEKPTHVYSTAGSFSVTLIVTSALGCRDTVVNPVVVRNPPVAKFSGGGAGCAPYCVTNYLDSSTCTDLNIANWQWSFPGGSPSSSTLQNPPSICYAAPGTYGASLIVKSNFGCVDSIALNPLVTVHPWPDAQFTVAPGIAPSVTPVFNFQNISTGGVTNFSWNFGDGSPFDTTSLNPIHSYSSTATANDFYSFNVCLRVETQFRCWDTICHPVELLPEFHFYIPNTITVNGDGNNEFFFGKSRGVKEYNIWIFDRWGNKIWDCKMKGKNTDWDSPAQDGMSSSCKWDGVVEKGGADMSGRSGLSAQEDVYVWKVKLTDIFDKKHTYIGHVNIIK